MSDIENWRDDLVQWESESRRVLAELKQLESMLQQHDLALVSHSEELLTHRQNLLKHEHALANYEQEGMGEDLIQGSRNHRIERDTHVSQQTRHEAIKHWHRRIVARWQELYNEVSQLPKM